MRRASDPGACLRDPRRYEREIHRLHQKHLFTKTLYELEQDNVPLARLIQRRREVAKLLAGAVARGEYRLEPGRVRLVERWVRRPDKRYADDGIPGRIGAGRAVAHDPLGWISRLARRGRPGAAARQG
mgnify:CR=1 FL=1